MKVLLTVLLSLAGAYVAEGQRVRFVPMLAGRPLVLDEAGALPDGTPVTVSQFRFYAGQFVFLRKGKVISRNTDFHLIDASEPASLTLDLDLAAAAIGDSISVLLGVDSLTNVSGAFGGDLDPVKGMYWTWNSGYINLKLEGSSTVSPYPSHGFELHLGGYLPPHATVQRVVLPVSGTGPWAVGVDVAQLLTAADVRTRCNLMSPGEQAVRLSQVAAHMFSHMALSPEDDLFNH